MYKSKKIMFLISETPMHAGSGSDLGIVDLPIQRERHTGFPKIEASSLKGAIRESFEGIINFEVLEKPIQINGNANNKDLHIVFGPEGDESHAGAIGFSDARLLLFPIKSMKGVFAWITCPKVLSQFKRDMEIIDKTVNLPTFEKLDKNQCYTNSKTLTFKNRIALEEYTFNCNEITTDFKIGDENFGEWLSKNAVNPLSSWAEKIKTDIIVLSDDDFKDFVELSTEVITRTKIDNATGTVAQGQLWTEEYLPAETMMYSLAFASDMFIDAGLIDKYSNSKLLELAVDSQNPKEKKLKPNSHNLVMTFLEKGIESLKNLVQIGGNATLGKGLTHIKIV